MVPRQLPVVPERFERIQKLFAIRLRPACVCVFPEKIVLLIGTLELTSISFQYPVHRVHKCIAIAGAELVMGTL